MIEAETFCRSATGRGFRLWTGVPCSYLTPFINHVIDAPDLRYVGAANEGDAVAIAAGFELGGGRAIALFQNSGLGNAVNPLTSLTRTFRIPILVIVTLRGEPGGPPDEPQHELMGAITTRMLELMEIPWAYFPRADAEVADSLARAEAEMRAAGRPFALVMRKGSVAPTPLRSRRESRPPGPVAAAPVAAGPARVTRREALQALQAAVGREDVVVATTGYTGRELYALEDRPNQIYLVGSMGCASSVGLGIALAQPRRRVVVVDGDGALLMRMGALTTIGYEHPANLVHLVLDNGQHESTGGQATVSDSVDLCAIARASGYQAARRVDDATGLAGELRRGEPGPLFLHLRTHPGVMESLPRPSVRPEEVAARLRHHLQAPP
jgi:phosphonopyruvate decarboxylase